MPCSPFGERETMRRAFRSPVKSIPYWALINSSLKGQDNPIKINISQSVILCRLGLCFTFRGASYANQTLWRYGQRWHRPNLLYVAPAAQLARAGGGAPLRDAHGHQ